MHTAVMTVARKLVLDNECIARFAKSGDNIYFIYGFDRSPQIDLQLEAIPQGYLVELTYPVFRRVDGVWIVLPDELADVVLLCQALCEKGVEIPSFRDLLLEFDARDVGGLYGIGVLGRRFSPEGRSGIRERSGYIYGGLMLHEIYVDAVLRHLRTYWCRATYRCRGPSIIKKYRWPEQGTVGSIARKMDDGDLAKFAKMIIRGAVELYFQDGNGNCTSSVQTVEEPSKEKSGDRASSQKTRSSSSGLSGNPFL